LPVLLGDRVWLDQNGDGIQGPAEPGTGRVRLTLTGTETAGGTPVQRETLSDSAGGYLFAGLRPGTYTLTLDVPRGRQVTQPHQGTDVTLDSDFASAAAQAAAVLAPAADELTVDAGLVATWQNPRQPLDVNGDGFITAQDVLLIVNDLNANGFRQLTVPPVAPQTPPPYLDIDGNGTAEPRDALLVINYLNTYGVGIGEGERDGAWPARAATAEWEEAGTLPAEWPGPRRGSRNLIVWPPLRAAALRPAAAGRLTW
jgi:hypothetical protein